ncbi:MAG: hypothetical protein WCK29_00485 [archaeon]
MKYDKLFWLEDHPDILPSVRLAGANMEEILGKTSFVHDYQTAQDLISRASFQFHILDADFPNVISPVHLNEVKSYLKKINEGNFTMSPILETTNGTPANHFVRFYLDNPSILEGKSIVLSASSVAPAYAYTLGLPFYAKGTISSHELKNLVKTELTRAHSPLAQSQTIESWECGNLNDLVQKYLQ